MDRRAFGDTGIKVSATGFGAWAIGGPFKANGREIGWGQTDDEESVAALAAAAEGGVTFIDTSDAYGAYGHSEEVIGRFLADRKRQDFVISTKVGKIRLPDQWTSDFTPKYVTRACERSLARLGTDVIDVYLTHGAGPEVVRDGAVFRTFEKLRDAGKIRCFGASLDSVEEGRALLVLPEARACQLPVNLYEPAFVDLVPELAAAGVGVIARSVFASGLLTGKLTEYRALPSTDHRRRAFAREALRENVRRIERFRPLMDAHHFTIRQLAAAYVASLPGVSTILVGTRTPGQARENARLGELPHLSRRECDLVRSIAAQTANA